MKKLFLASCFLLLANAIFASDDCIPVKPSEHQLIFNFSDSFPDFLSREEASALEQKLQAFSNETSNQITVVIVDDMCGFEAPDFSFRLFDKWGIGQDKIDNGILIIIKPTGGEGKRDIGIVVGRGLEGVIPDAVAGKIKRNELIPYLLEKRNYEGLNAATDVLMGLAKGEFNSDAYANNTSRETPWVLIAAAILFIILAFALRKRKGYTIGSGRTYYGGGWTSWGGGGGFGGGSGGGFGGFGGGSTGGGGSFGKW